VSKSAKVVTKRRSHTDAIHPVNPPGEHVIFGRIFADKLAHYAADLAIMRRLDRLHLEFPFAGSRMLRGLLAAEGCKIGRRRVKTLMRRMGIEALYRRSRTSKPEPGHKVYPYLLRGIVIERPNQVWAMDITYIPMARGFVYLAVVLDWFSRRVLAAPSFSAVPELPRRTGSPGGHPARYSSVA
jgi:hypothetical protein